MQLGEDLILMQDGAPGHAAAKTKEDLRERGITVMDWPPFSPDLNPYRVLLELDERLDRRGIWP